MHYTSMTVICLCSLVAVAPVAAGEKKDGHSEMRGTDAQVMMETYKKLSMPGEQHKQLASLAGSWTMKTKEWMDPSKPATESTGSCENKVLLDGRYLQQECASQMMGQPYRGIAIQGYDNLKNKYVATWIDSMGTGIFVMEGAGSPDGKTITFYGSHPDPFVGEMKHRAIWRLVDSDTHTFEMYGSHGNDPEAKMMEIVYTRR